jgi:hypothetical protein
VPNDVRYKGTHLEDMAVSRLRCLLGFIHRVAYATLISFVVWFLWTARFDRLPLDRDLQLGIVKVLDFPVAMVSERMPLTGWLSIDPFTRDQMGHNEPNEKVLLRHLRLAVPVTRQVRSSPGIAERIRM